ncbi:hypothetical protein COI51_16645 [Bacillus toyonensis]|nr:MULTISPECIES: hypothetical protein [Bacillus cereus group]MBJ7929286.1 hypothetical protein [Bacillus cereus group sp. N31]PEG15626.1 hypothetical protein COO04_14230 [Bacillus toyonensis]PEM15631.1 hypothetical protein CN616_21735 [Bacillus toyonensis]PFZ73027.1 hypothetical protein COL82_24960 [Bacillus toyonensis]PGA11946.1 hypothetical protein COL67_00780 [Bacillus toyonensis]
MGLVVFLCLEAGLFLLLRKGFLEFQKPEKKFWITLESLILIGTAWMLIGLFYVTYIISKSPE